MYEKYVRYFSGYWLLKMINSACHSLVYCCIVNVRMPCIYGTLGHAETMYLFSIHAKFNVTKQFISNYNWAIQAGWKHFCWVRVIFRCWTFEVWSIVSVRNYAKLPTICLLDFSANNVRFSHIPVYMIVKDCNI